MANEKKLPGAIKFDSQKAKMALIPPRALAATGRVMTFGAQKYAADNYLEGGMTVRQLLSANLRHLNQLLAGEDLDSETGESHLAHAACCSLMALEGLLTNSIEDDRFVPKSERPNPKED